VRAGSLDHAIDLLTYQETGADSLNETEYEWVATAANVPAALEQMTSSERIAAGELMAQKTRVFVIRHREDVKPGENRALRFAGELYDIKAVDPLPGRHIGLRIIAVARAE
jgi:SPP1 family predicted phage head-tail adaptor